MRAFFAAAFWLVVRVSGAQADSGDWPELTDTANSTGARAAAEWVEARCSNILGLVPRLSPAEDTWLQGELDAKRDLSNLMLRPEYAKRVLFVHFYTCKNLAHQAAVEKTEKARVMAWVGLTSRFVLGSELEFHLKRIKSRDLSEAAEPFIKWEHLNSSDILDNIVLPYLRDH